MHAQNYFALYVSSEQQWEICRSVKVSQLLLTLYHVNRWHNIDLIISPVQLFFEKVAVTQCTVINSKLWFNFDVISLKTEYTIYNFVVSFRKFLK